MVLFGLRGLIRREQARQLLAWSVRRHWGFISPAGAGPVAAGQALFSPSPPLSI